MFLWMYLSVHVKALYVSYYRLVFVWEKVKYVFICFLLVHGVCVLFITVFCTLNKASLLLATYNIFKYEDDYDGF